MKNKRILSVLLAVVMTFVALPVATLASDSDWENVNTMIQDDGGDRLVEISPFFTIMRPVPIVLQEQTQWCWVGSSVSILAFHGINRTQSEFIRSSLGHTDNVPGNSQSVITGLNRAGMVASSSGPITNGAVLTELDRHAPIILGYLHSHGGHMVVVWGINSTSDIFHLMCPGLGRNITRTGYELRNGPERRWLTTIRASIIW